LILILVACAETTPLPSQAYVLDGIPICGRAHALSKSQIRAAITADRQWSSQSEQKIYSVEVSSSSEIYIYHTKRNKQLEEYNVVRLVDGKWEVQDRKMNASGLGPIN
jgi:enterochelin esterase-like enzyme